MNLTRRELTTLLNALESAIDNEFEFIDCHMAYGKSIDPKTTRKTAAFIKRMKSLQKKIGRHLASTKESE